MDLPFRDFIAAYNDGSIVEDASWRAYDIEEMTSDKSLKSAMRALYASKVSQVAADYGISSPGRAEMLLKLWFTWRNIALGYRKRGLIERGRIL